MAGAKAAPLELHLVCDGTYGQVKLSSAAKKEFDVLRARKDENGMREAATVDRYIARYAEVGPDRLDNPKQFKALGRFKDGTGNKIQLFEFKAYQWRLYGVQREHQGRRCFIGLGVDASKKTNRADQDLLARCAKLSAQI